LEILKSGILKEIPLDIFGIQENDLIDIIANAPAKSMLLVQLLRLHSIITLVRESFFWQHYAVSRSAQQLF
jgi:hypothetical protein